MDQEIKDPRAEFYCSLRYRRPRGPRFALLILIIFAILSLLLAIIVAYVIV